MLCMYLWKPNAHKTCLMKLMLSHNKTLYINKTTTNGKYVAIEKVLLPFMRKRFYGLSIISASCCTLVLVNFVMLGPSKCKSEEILSLQTQFKFIRKTNIYVIKLSTIKCFENN